MKHFTYNQNNYDLNSSACLWLKQMGLRETLWILDAGWLLSSYEDLTYNKWIWINK